LRWSFIVTCHTLNIASMASISQAIDKRFYFPRLCVTIATIFHCYLPCFNCHKYGICVASQWWGFYSNTLCCRYCHAFLSILWWYLRRKNLFLFLRWCHVGVWFHCCFHEKWIRGYSDEKSTTKKTVCLREKCDGYVWQ
jgi:hypothetical protein